VIEYICPVVPYLLIYQIFEEGSTHRGRLKAMGRGVVKTHYSDALTPRFDISDGCNSDQYNALIRQQITQLLDKSSFMLGLQRDENVSVFDLSLVR